MTKRSTIMPKAREFALEAIYPELAKRLDESAPRRGGPSKPEGEADADPRSQPIQLRQIRFQTR